MFDRILIAVDGSECALRGAKYGLGLASSAGATVDVVHVADKADSDHADAVLDEVADLAADIEVPAELYTLDGNPPNTILAHADERAVDLIVIGRQGHTGLGERLLGSVANRVLRRADIPVLTVPAESEKRDVTDILVTTDGSEAAEQAVPYGAMLATQWSARVHVLTVVDLQKEAGPFNAGGVTEEVIEVYEQNGQEAVNRFAGKVKEEAPSLSVETAVVRDRVYEGIHSYVTDQGVDLVVMSSAGESSIVGQVLGSVTERTLRTVDVPVVVVPATGKTTPTS